MRRRGAFVVLLLIGLSGGWVLSPQGGDRISHAYQRVAFQQIADRVTNGSKGFDESVVRITEYVHSHVTVPPAGKPIGDVEPLDILASGRGYCDQQANVAIQLLRTLPMDAQLVFLRDADGVSPHSIAEVSLEGAWRVVDPLLGVALRTPDGHLATREDLARSPQLLVNHPDLQATVALGSTADLPHFAQWYRYPPTVFNRWRGKRQAWLDRCPARLRRWVTAALQALYFWTAPAAAPQGDARQLARARHEALLGRGQVAERRLRRLIHRTRQVAAREDAWFFLGCLCLDEGRHEEAVQALQHAVQEDQGGGWSGAAYVSMGRAYEALGRPQEALEAYERSRQGPRDPWVGQRVMRLRSGRRAEEVS